MSNIKDTIIFLFLSALLSCTSLNATAQHGFTAMELSSISVPTPGLFTHSNAFNIDFSILKPEEYSFPLPVGKAEVKGGQALEITTTKGDAVKAMFNGRVRLSRRTSQYGNTIVIRHDNGLETVYANNAQNLVSVGSRVKAGQTIAIVGSDNGKTYCLFAIMVNGGWINPETVINPKSHKLRKQVLQCKKTGKNVSVTVLNQEKNENTSLDPDISNDDYENGSSLKIDLKKIEQQHWAYPLPDAKVISPYGGRGGRGHSGVDIKTKANDEILAAFDGIVERSGPYYGYGNYIVIRHAYGFSTCYSHQSKNFVKAGQKVKAGEVIGLTGQTGRATTPHLHFEIRFCGKPIDPAIFFDHANHTLKAQTLTVKKGQKTLSSQKNK